LLLPLLRGALQLLGQLSLEVLAGGLSLGGLLLSDLLHLVDVVSQFLLHSLTVSGSLLLSLGEAALKAVLELVDLHSVEGPLLLLDAASYLFVISG